MIRCPLGDVIAGDAERSASTPTRSRCDRVRARRASRSTSRGIGSHCYVQRVMHRPLRFEHSRYVGDKRTQLVYDLDEWDDESVVNEFVNLGVGIAFGPDTLAEARNRGYTLATAGSRRMHRKSRA